MKIWTDGAASGNPGFGGWAHLNDRNGEVRSGSHYPATNNQMEMHAILEALMTCAEENDRITLYTDSKVCINWLKLRWKINKEYNKVLREAIDEHIMQLRLTMNYVLVKGHSSNRYNNIVDKAAATAAKQLRAKHGR